MFYRDGVAENQFSEVLEEEVAAIKGACEDVKPGWNLPLTFVVVQKRHNTRLFPNDRQNQVRCGRWRGRRGRVVTSCGCLGRSWAAPGPLLGRSCGPGAALPAGHLH